MDIVLVIVALALLILIHEAGHFFAAKMFGIKVEEFGFGFPPKLIWKKFGETVYSLNLIPFGGFVRIFGEDSEVLDEEGVSEEEKKRAFVHQKPWKKSVVILAGVVMNIFLAWILLAGALMIGSPQKLVITDVADNSPAVEAGLEANDVILEVSSGANLIEGVINTENFIQFINEQGNEEMNLLIQREAEQLSLSMNGRENPPAGEGSLGITFIDVGFEREGFFSAIFESLKMTWEGLILIIVSFATLIASIFTPASGAFENLTGPVGIFVIAQQAGSLGIVYLLQLTAIISLNLAILNLIPFPALDGGRFLVIITEKIKGSPVSSKVQNSINAVGFILLLILMVVVTVKDVGRFIL